MDAHHADPPGDTRDLLRRVLDGNDAAFTSLYDRYHQFILATFLGLGFDHTDSWDLMQESFLHALRGLKTLDLEQPVHFGGWMATIARNVARREWSRRQRSAATGLGAQAVPDIPDLAAEADLELLDATADHTALFECIAILGPQLRSIVIAKYLWSYSFRQVGPLVGCSEATVRNHLAEALDLLAACLQGKGVWAAE